MHVNPNGLSIVLIACAIGGLGYTLRTALRVAGDTSRTQRLGRYGSAALTGVGLGLAAASVIVIRGCSLSFVESGARHRLRG